MKIPTWWYMDGSMKIPIDSSQFNYIKIPIWWYMNAYTKIPILHSLIYSYMKIPTCWYMDGFMKIPILDSLTIIDNYNYIWKCPLGDIWMAIWKYLLGRVFDAASLGTVAIHVSFMKNSKTLETVAIPFHPLLYVSINPDAFVSSLFAIIVVSDAPWAFITMASWLTNAFSNQTSKSFHWISIQSDIWSNFDRKSFLIFFHFYSFFQILHNMVVNK